MAEACDMRGLSYLLFAARPIKMNKDGYTGFVKYTIPELEDAGCIVAKAING